MDNKILIHRIKQKTVKVDDHRLYLQKLQPRIVIHRKQIQISKVAYAIANNLEFQHAASLPLVATCGYPMCIEPSHLEIDGPDVIIPPRKGIPYAMLEQYKGAHPNHARDYEKAQRDRLFRVVTKYFTTIERNRAERTSENIIYGQRKNKFNLGLIDLDAINADTLAHNAIIQRLDDELTDCDAILLANSLTVEEAQALYHRAEWLRKANESRAATRKKRLESTI